MSLQKFTWVNGTPTSPITLTADEINVLIAAKKAGNIDMTVSGYYNTTSGSIRNYLYQVLKDLFPNLNYVGAASTIVADDVQISLEGVESMNEGTETRIVSTGNVPMDYLSFQFSYVSGSVDTPADITDRLSVVKKQDAGGNDVWYLKASKPIENTTWNALLNITAYPSYLAEIPQSGASNRADYNIRVNAVALNGIYISGSTDIKQGQRPTYTVLPTNANTTKITENTIYSLAISPNNTGISPVIGSYAPGDYGSLTGNGNTWVFNAAAAGTSTFTANIFLLSTEDGGSSIASASLQVACTQGVLNNTITISQQASMAASSAGSLAVIDGTNPLTHYDNIAMNQDGTFKSGQDNAFAWVRENSHLYVGKWSYDVLNSNEVMNLRQLSDSDKRVWDDNPEGVATLNDPSYGDVWLKLPEFWYKLEPYKNSNNEIVANAYTFSVAVEDPAIGSLTGDWIHWDGLTLIAVYEGYMYNNRLYSVSGQNPYARSACNVYDGDPTNPVSYNAASATIQTYKHTYAANRGSNFHLVSWEAHCIMALLGYAYYGSVDIQSICGRGTPTHWSVSGTTYYFPRVTGLCDSYGMNDTVKSVVDAWEDGTQAYDIDGTRIPDANGYIDIQDDKSVNFWGLENWWGNINEFMDNVMTVDTSKHVGIFALGAYFISGGKAQVSSSNSTEVEPTVVADASTASAACIKGFQFLNTDGDFVGLIPQATLSDANYASGFCDYGNVPATASFVAYRSSTSATLDGGLSYFAANYGLGAANAHFGSRLLYKAPNAASLNIVTSEATWALLENN